VRERRDALGGEERPGHDEGDREQRSPLRDQRRAEHGHGNPHEEELQRPERGEQRQPADVIGPQVL